MSQPLLARLLASSVSIANRAGEIVRDVMASGNLGISEKTGKDDLQTLADRSAQDVIVTSLLTQFPGLNVIGEEGKESFGLAKEEWIVKDCDPEVLKMTVPEKYKSANLDDFTVWVDPLDGTKEYTEGYLDHVTVLIGIAVGDDAVGGVIHQPYFNYQDKTKTLGRTVYGMLGAGAVGIVRGTKPEGPRRIVTTTRSHGTGLVEDSIRAVNPTDVIKVGGAGHKVMLLLDGVADAYVFPTPGCKKWDTCAPEAILHALGGKLTDIKGNTYKYNKDVQHVNEWGVLATATEAEHASYLTAIPQDLKEQVKDYFKNRKKK